MLKKLEYWLVWITFLLLFFSYIFIFGDAGLIKLARLKKNRYLIKKQIISLIADNQQLRKEIETIQSNPFHTERVLREQLNLVKPNEFVYQIVNDYEKNENNEIQGKRE